MMDDFEFVEVDDPVIPDASRPLATTTTTSGSSVQKQCDPVVVKTPPKVEVDKTGDGDRPRKRLKKVVESHEVVKPSVQGLVFPPKPQVAPTLGRIPVIQGGGNWSLYNQQQTPTLLKRDEVVEPSPVIDLTRIREPVASTSSSRFTSPSPTITPSDPTNSKSKNVALQHLTYQHMLAMKQAAARSQSTSQQPTSSQSQPSFQLRVPVASSSTQSSTPSSSHRRSSGLPVTEESPICIGLLSSLVLILYPVKELEGDIKMAPNGSIVPQTLPVSLLRAAPSNGHETIRVLGRGGEAFGVVEHRVANVLGPFLGVTNSYSGVGPAGGWKNPLLHAQPGQASTSTNGISASAMRDNQNSTNDSSSDEDVIETDGFQGPKKPTESKSPLLNDSREVYIECCVVRRGEQSPIMLPLQLLIFCIPTSILKVSQTLSQHGIWLEHPISYDPLLHAGCRYSNPHNPQFRQHDTAIQLQSDQQEQMRRRLLMGSTSNNTNLHTKCGSGGHQPKSVEVQREQVDEVFKSLRSGVDLDQVEPNPIVITPLYPHQKQALSFMLDREKLKDVQQPQVNGLRRKMNTDNEQDGDEEDLVSLWQRKKDVYGRLTSWQNVVTQVIKPGPEPPSQCRGCILADDMGLGKTITVISLIASTLEQAQHYSTFPPNKTIETSKLLTGSGGDFDVLKAHGAEDNSTNLTTLSTTFPPPRGGGKKKENKTVKKRIEAETERLSNLKLRSRATLIVCPLSTVQNWESQIDEHVKHTRKNVEDDSQFRTSSALKVYVYHGNSRTNCCESLADYDVVITTYSLLASEYSRQHRGKDLENDASNKTKQSGGGGNESSDGIEEVDSQGNSIVPTCNATKSKKSSNGVMKRKRKGDGQLSPLQCIQWFRIVLDEAHMIKEHSTICARAACDLVAERRACLTGTPLQNSLNDLFSLLRFLRLEPFTDRGIWTAHIGAPAKLGDPLGVKRLQLIMRHLALRRTKASKDQEGKPILTLPVKKESMIYLELDEREKAFYYQHHKRSKKTFITLAKTDSLLKNYCSVLQELLRLRQICAHMGLVAEGEDSKSEDLVSSIKSNGLSKTRAVQLLGLFRDSGATQCAECNVELLPSNLHSIVDDDNQHERSGLVEEEVKKPTVGGQKRVRKKVAAVIAEGDETLGPDQRPILTRCQHLFCLSCFKNHVSSRYPKELSASDVATCSVCKEEIIPVLDAIEVLPCELEAFTIESKQSSNGRKKKEKGERVFEHSTKIRHLLMDLLPFSQANPASTNFSPQNFQDPDPNDPESIHKAVKGLVGKSVVFSQWTKLLDRIADALDQFGIEHVRLDGTMARDERTKSMDQFRLVPKCEVLLVSLRAGGVGLNLTAAQRVYLMEPFWNPAVENQAVDRVHRLGQTRPVQTIRYIIKGSVEQSMLKIQKRKTDLANMSMGQTLSKAELAQRRVDDLNTLFKDPPDMSTDSQLEESSSSTTVKDSQSSIMDFV